MDWVPCSHGAGRRACRQHPDLERRRQSPFQWVGKRQLSV